MNDSSTSRLARDPEANSPLRVDRDRIYRETPERTLAMDVYRASDGESRPAVVLLHGGGWREGNKGQLSRYALDLAAAGYVTVEPSYRLSHEATFPAALEDVKAAVRHVRSNAAELGVDPGRVGAFGHSAGAHLAVLAGATGDRSVLGSEPAAAYEETARLDAVVGVSGVYDLTREPSTDGTESSSEMAVAFLGGHYEEVPERYAAASVHAHVDAGGDGDCPPTLFSHGTADDVVGAGQSERCHEALAVAGVDTDLHLADGGDHVFLHSSAWYPETFPRYREFFDSRV
ncbi:alpha/beta fold hydrolase [Halobium salinum]|uniref:Alpha/beta fold hydrolase n=1 Tax=Halobium salinum TaxID=1364940 RepID=A0ABD5PDR2_9EURY|nr:alpha/beta hydrolase [Halobium salinum]